jgi:hypothetical protein
MDLDKWQQREAQQYATDNGVSYEEAVTALFVGEPPAPAEVTNPAEAPAPDAKVSVTK